MIIFWRSISPPELQCTGAAESRSGLSNSCGLPVLVPLFWSWYIAWIGIPRDCCWWHGADGLWLPCTNYFVRTPLPRNIRHWFLVIGLTSGSTRSEERRVGKGGRAREEA